MAAQQTPGDTTGDKTASLDTNRAPTQGGLAAQRGTNAVRDWTDFANPTPKTNIHILITASDPINSFLTLTQNHQDGIWETPAGFMLPEDTHPIKAASRIAKDVVNMNVHPSRWLLVAHMGTEEEGITYCFRVHQVGEEELTNEQQWSKIIPDIHSRRAGWLPIHPAIQLIRQRKIRDSTPEPLLQFLSATYPTEWITDWKSPMPPLHFYLDPEWVNLPRRMTQTVLENPPPPSQINQNQTPPPPIEQIAPPPTSGNNPQSRELQLYTPPTATPPQTTPEVVTPSPTLPTRTISPQNYSLLKSIPRPAIYGDPSQKKQQQPNPKDWIRTITDHFQLAGFAGDVGLPFSSFLTGTVQKWFNTVRDEAALTNTPLTIGTIKTAFLQRYDPSTITEAETARLALLSSNINMAIYPNYYDYENAFQDAVTLCKMAKPEQTTLFLTGLTSSMRSSVAYHPVTREQIRDIDELFKIARRENEMRVTNICRLHDAMYIVNNTTNYDSNKQTSRNTQATFNPHSNPTYPTYLEPQPQLKSPPNTSNTYSAPYQQLSESLASHKPTMPPPPPPPPPPTANRGGPAGAPTRYGQHANQSGGPQGGHHGGQGGYQGGRQGGYQGGQGSGAQGGQGSGVQGGQGSGAQGGQGQKREEGGEIKWKSPLAVDLWHPYRNQVEQARRARDTLEHSANPACLDANGVMFPAFMQTHGRFMNRCLRCGTKGHRDMIKGGQHTCNAPSVWGPMPPMGDQGVRNGVMPDPANPVYGIIFHPSTNGPSGSPPGTGPAGSHPWPGAR